MAQAPLNALRVFEAVARHGSFGRAADELCVTQSAVSHQIRHLEEWLGGPLFDREGNRPRLRPHGADLGRALALALADIDAACRHARKAVGPPALTVAVIPSVAICWLIPRLADFQAQSPGTELRILYAIHGKDSDFRDADVAVVFSEGEPEVPGTTATRFLPGASAPVCSRGFAQAHVPLDTPEAMLNAGLLHGDCITITGKTMAENLAHIAPPDPDGKVLRAMNNPIHPTGGITILHGSLAPEGAVVKSAGFDSDVFEGTARVFDGEREDRKSVV